MEKEKRYELLWKFFKGHDQCSMSSPQFSIAEKILEEEGMNDYILFLYNDDFGIVNMKEIGKEEVFWETVSINETEDTILALWDNPGVVYLYTSAISFLKSICTNPELIKDL